ncbi:hypothetical protein L1987_75231 [Smallanthus sonchifolius]|uniref:Uncharacterized protein n=1 Tax=Smallanthus sonchifolius TaxID=185202 RepID=A0ACB9A5J1_9ASTR|nr:hypothetical protein L1987_75231 [Smallanthus sonchifolius]
MQIKLHEGNGVGESFRVLYYGSAAAGSVPFMWESQPGTPKHALTESSLPPLTPPPSYHQRSQKYKSSMQLMNHHSSETAATEREHCDGGCLGGGFKRSCRSNKMKKTILWFVCHGKA